MNLSKRLPLVCSLLVALLSAATSVQSVYAATNTVTSTDDSGAGSLREALGNAANGDTIDATGVSGTILLTSGELLVSNSVTITGPGNLAVDGNFPNTTNRVFHITNAVTVAISSLTITNGAESNDNGGGIWNDHSTLTMSNCAVSGNWTGGDGGGIWNNASGGGATLTIANSTLSGNAADVEGGGIFNDGSAGGWATLIISNSTVSGNTALYAGGIENKAQQGIAALTLIASTLNDNLAQSGGGIYNEGYSGGAYLTIAKSTLSDNWADGGSGGGIFNDGRYGGKATASINASTLSSNAADVAGGAIYNQAAFAGMATLKIADSILNACIWGGNIANVGGVVKSAGYNLSSDGGNGILTGIGDQVDTDPLLDPSGLQDNGGPTRTIALQSGSPAIGKGKRNVYVTLASQTDQRGLPRPMYDAGVVLPTRGDGSDIGAFEVQTGMPPCPDLTGVWSNLTQTCTNWLNGLHCKVRGILVMQNVGITDAPSSVLRFFLSDNNQLDGGALLLRQMRMGIIKPYPVVRRTTLSANLPIGASASGKFILAVMDATNNVAECSETNNVIVFGPVP
jgi:hypothetical protein